MSEISAEEFSYPLSEQQVRHRLQQLENEGYIVKRKGRAGTKLTHYGMKIIAKEQQVFNV